MSTKRRSSRREAYRSTSSLENGGRKSPIKIEIRKDFYLITVSFTFFDVSEIFFILRTFSVLPNVTAPIFLLAIFSQAFKTYGDLAVTVLVTLKFYCYISVVARALQYGNALSNGNISVSQRTAHKSATAPC